MKPNKLSTMVLKVFARMVVNHIMCLIVSLSVLIMLPDFFGALIAQVCNLGILLIMSYTYVWHIGNNDRNKYNFGHIKRDLNRGLWAGLISYAPFLLMAVALPLCKAGIISHEFLPYYRMIMSPFMPFNQLVMPTTLTMAEQSWLGVTLSTATAAVVPVALWIGYRMGFRQISFTDTFFAKSSDNQ